MLSRLVLRALFQVLVLSPSVCSSSVRLDLITTDERETLPDAGSPNAASWRNSTASVSPQTAETEDWQSLPDTRPSLGPVQGARGALRSPRTSYHWQVASQIQAVNETQLSVNRVVRFVEAALLQFSDELYANSWRASNVQASSTDDPRLPGEVEDTFSLFQASCLTAADMLTSQAKAVVNKLASAEWAFRNTSSVLMLKLEALPRLKKLGSRSQYWAVHEINRTVGEANAILDQMAKTLSKDITPRQIYPDALERWTVKDAPTSLMNMVEVSRDHSKYEELRALFKSIQDISARLHELRLFTQGQVRASRSLLPGVVVSLAAHKLREEVQLRKGGGLCIGDRTVPQIYILGAMKAGTTSMAYILRSFGAAFAGVPLCQECVNVTHGGTTVVPLSSQEGCSGGATRWHPRKDIHDELSCRDAHGVWFEKHYEKERNLFNRGGDRGGHFDVNLEDFCKENFLEKLSSGFPKCPGPSEPPLVATDITPTYFADPLAPLRLHTAYSGVARDLVLGVIVREPLSRFQSAYNHFELEPWLEGRLRDQMLEFRGFKHFARAALQARGTRLPCPYGVWSRECSGSSDDRAGLDMQLLRMLDGSLYGKSLHRWLQLFESRQILCVPMRHLVEGGVRASQVVNQIRAMIGADNFKPDKHTNTRLREILQQPPHANVHAHRASEEDALDGDTARQLQDVLDADSEDFAALLANHSRIRLPTYRGQREQGAILDWMRMNW